MATKTWYFTGTCKWAKLHEPDPKYNKFSIDLYLDAANMEKFRQSGAQLKLRGTEDEPFISFGRPAVSLGKKGQLIEHGPPLVLDHDGAPMSPKILVGNGSTVTVKVDVYDTQKGKGTRLEAVRVDKLVEYVKREVDEDVDVPF